MIYFHLFSYYCLRFIRNCAVIAFKCDALVSAPFSFLFRLKNL